MTIGRCYTSHLSQRSNRRIFDAESHRDRVGTLETDASDVSGKPIGVLGHDLQVAGVRWARWNSGFGW
jgi:hypothetical protein